MSLSSSIADSIRDFPRKMRDLPDNLRLAALGAWLSLIHI